MAYNQANETEPISIKELAELLSSFSEEITTEVAISSENNKAYCNYKRVALDTSEIEKLEEGVKRTYLCSIINKV